MQQELIKSILGTLIRTLTTGLGAYLVGKNYITEADFQALVAGLVLLVASLVWSVYQKIQSNKWVQVALTLPETATIEDVKAKASKPLNYVGAIIPFLLVLSVVTSQSACFRGKDPAAKPAVYSAQSAAALAGVQDVLITFYDNGVIKDKKVFAQHDKITTGMEVFYARIQANGYDKKDAIKAIQQVLTDVETFQNDLTLVSDPNARVKLGQVFFTLQFTLNSIKAVIEASKEPDPNAVLATRDKLLQPVNAPWWTTVVLIVQDTALRLIAQSRMTADQAWADTAAIISSIHQKNSAKLLAN